MSLSLTKEICIALKESGFPQASPVKYDTEDGPVCCPSLEELIDSVSVTHDFQLSTDPHGWKAVFNLGSKDSGWYMCVAETPTLAVAKLYLYLR